MTLVMTPSNNFSLFFFLELRILWKFILSITRSKVTYHWFVSTTKLILNWLLDAINYNLKEFLLAKIIKVYQNASFHYVFQAV